MRTVIVAKQKGGVGATTLVREIGVAAAASGKRVIFVDLDPQGTLRGWWNRRTEGVEDDPNPGLATPDPAAIEPALEQLRDVGADLCLVDFPPSIHPFPTPDGPRGPRRQAALGVAQIAALSGAPILPCAAQT